MSLVCAQCSRVNPAEAAYCYHDGAALAGRAGGPLNAGSAPFPSNFVFPSGMACRNFDQLAMACQEHWQAAIGLLKQGYLGSFFGGMGRVDLAMAAQEAAKYPDLDRGLDQLLAKLPTQTLQAPKLQAEPTKINLGQLKVGDDRNTELHLTNLGMRLLYGTVTSDCKWLTLGEGSGHAEKLFQFGSELKIPVHVRGQHLRAGSKPMEGRLVVDSNGGTITITFSADVPITPYPGEMFTGAITPRQVAEKAKANARDAASFFEGGAIATWYASNGWAYPVQGPTMSGMGAIQQFFEALGVAKAPKVEVNPKVLELQGAVGRTVEATLEVTEVAGKDKKKFVYGWASCDQPWIEIGKSKLAGGKSAIIPITLRIPSPCSTTLEATITVVGNGSQKMPVPLKVSVAGGTPGYVLKGPAEEYDAVEIVEEDAPALPISAPSAPITAVAVTAPAPATGSAPEFPASVELVDEASPFTVASGTLAFQPAAPVTIPAARTKAAPKPHVPLPMAVRLVLHLLPLAILAFCLLVLLIRDVFFTLADSGVGSIDGEVPHILVKFDEGKLEPNTNDSMSFGVHYVDPDNKNAPVKLNYYDRGQGNSTVARIDGKELMFGQVPFAGRWAADSEFAGKPAGKLGKSRTFEFTTHKVHATQTVTVESGDAGEEKKALNTCLVRYKLVNRDAKNHRVGLRVLLDTCIGDNDGVPFTLPGVKEMVSTFKDFDKPAEVPDFVQVLQNPDLASPGVVVQLNLRISDALEPPGRFLLTRYPVTGPTPNKQILGKWEIEARPFENDSCVVLYWEERVMKPNDTRELGFTYGVGKVSATTGKLGVTVGGAMLKDSELTIVALVADPGAKTVTLQLPDHLKLLDDQSAVQNVPALRSEPDGKTRPSPVTWRVRATEVGAKDVVVSTDTKLTQSRRVTITLKSLFN